MKRLLGLRHSERRLWCSAGMVVLVMQLVAEMVVCMALLMHGLVMHSVLVMLVVQLNAAWH